jgi:DedD protein
VRGGGERVLESRHLVGLFLGVVLLCGVFFTLGYVMGRTQTTPSVLANEPSGPNTIIGLAPKPPAPAASAAPAAHGEGGPASVDAKWDFDKDQNVLEPKPAATAVKNVKASSGNSKAGAASTSGGSVDPRELKRFAPPPMKRGTTVLQLAAVSKETDALLLADTLRQKNFPSFVVTPTNDSLYRVQVGPYADVPAAERAKEQLDHAGFKAIVKR